MPAMKKLLACVQILVSCSKGISNDTLETVNQIMTRVLPKPLHNRLAYLSGPSFAAEVRPAMFSYHLPSPMM